MNISKSALLTITLVIFFTITAHAECPPSTVHFIAPNASFDRSDVKLRLSAFKLQIKDRTGITYFDYHPERQQWCKTFNGRNGSTSGKCLSTSGRSEAGAIQDADGHTVGVMIANPKNATFEIWSANSNGQTDESKPHV